MLKLYKATISKWKGRKRCIFTPSCSVYSMEAYQRYGFLKGSLMTAKRLLRCNPMNKGGFDPVPLNVKGDAKWYV